MTKLSRFFASLLLAALATFCAYGFLASFERPFPNAWHVFYAGSGTLLSAILWRIWRHK